MKFPASQEVKRNKSPYAAAYFTAKLFLMPQAYFKNPAGIYFIEKSTLSRAFFCEDRTIEMFLHFHCLDLNTRHNHSTSLRFCFQGCLQRHLDFGAADKDHLDFLF